MGRGSGHQVGAGLSRPYVKRGSKGRSVRVELGFGLPDWIISDTHFLHTRLNEVYEAEARQVLGSSVDEALISRWREVVGSNDLVLHLGDLCLGKREDFAAISTRLTGRKLMLKTGNHDRRPREWYEEHGFLLVPEFWLDWRGWRVRFTHRPDDERLFVSHPKTLNVHGHIHSKTRDNRRLINASVEVQDFRPWRLAQLLDTRIAELENR